MKKRIFVLSLMLIAIVCGCLPMLSACGDKEIIPREIVIEVINPITGEVMKEGDKIDIPEEHTKIEVRIKDKETGALLTDNDLPENTLKDSYVLNFRILDENGSMHSTLCSNGYWPIETELDAVYDQYGIAVYFGCRPKNMQGNPGFQRIYKTTSYDIRFYINRQK